MIYFGIKARIIGDFVLKEPIFTHSNGYQISIFIEESQYKISVIKSVPDKSPLQIHYKISEEYTGPTAPDESCYADYIKLLQDIEALGGLNYGITKIFYKETLELCWYSGKDVFQDLKIICSLEKQYNPPKKRLLSQSNLSSILFLNKQIPNAKVPYTYYREANGFLQNQEYRLAYLHFFMLLEFCYTTHTKEKEVVSDFCGSIDLNLALLSSLQSVKEHSKDIYDWIVESVAKQFQSFGLRTLYRFLFSYRGKLAHGTKRSSPFLFKEDDLRNVTIFIGHVCLIACGNMQVYCMSSEDYNNARKLERIEKYKKELSIS